MKPSASLLYLLAVTLCLFVVLPTGCVHDAAARQPPPAVQAPEPKRSIAVNGIARLDVAPDRCRLQLTLTAEATRPNKAVRALAAKRTKLVAALKGAGVEDDDLQLGYLNVTTRYGSGSERHVIKGYDASISLVIVITDFDRIGDLMELAAIVGVGRMWTRFENSRMHEHKKKARDLALEAAKEKAEQMTRHFGLAVGPVLEIRESQEFNRGAWAANNYRGNAYEPAASQAGALRPGALPLSLTVHVTFSLAK